MTACDQPLNVGFSYHVEVDVSDPAAPRTQAILGLYLRELAKQAGHVTFYAHSMAPDAINDHVLDDPRVRIVDLGPKRSAPALRYAPGPSLRNFRPVEDGVDVLLIRGPSAFLPQLVRAAGDIPVVLQLVGDMKNEVSQPHFSAWRNLAIRLWRRHYMWAQDRIADRTLVLAKSEAIRKHSGAPFRRSEVVFTSTLPASALTAAPVTSPEWGGAKGSAEPLRLVYSGRIVVPKGLFEAVEAVAELVARGRNVELHIIGWSNPRDGADAHLLARARDLGVGDRVILDGYRPAGPDLLAELSRSDVYLFPTYGEGGVARAIVEAMAVGLPVITTDIPAVHGLLADGRNAVLVPPRSSSAIVSAVERLLDDAELRTRIATNGMAFGRELTIERSVELTLHHIRGYLGVQRNS